jgi:hypothetical protein
VLFQGISSPALFGMTITVSSLLQSLCFSPIQGSNPIIAVVTQKTTGKTYALKLALADHFNPEYYILHLNSIQRGAQLDLVQRQLDYLRKQGEKENSDEIEFWSSMIEDYLEEIHEF